MVRFCMRPSSTLFAMIETVSIAKVLSNPLLRIFLSGLAVVPLLSHLVVPKAYASENYFHTPSKNIWCAYQADRSRLRCDVMQRKWKDWGCKQYGCFGPSFILPDIGKARPKEVSDSLFESSQYSLKYGSSISLGKITCVSETSGLTCRNKSGGYLHLNREFYVAR